MTIRVRTDLDARTLTLAGLYTSTTVAGWTVYELQDLADAAAELRDHQLARLDDVCECNGGDLPAFDHDRLCPRRVLAMFGGVVA